MRETPRSLSEGNRESPTGHRRERRTLEGQLGFSFRQGDLLDQALTHKSFAHEASAEEIVAHNESLEFLGDAVLGFLVTDCLYRDFSHLDEGRLSKIKAHLVSAATLSRLAGELGIPDHLLLGKGEEKTGGRRKSALRANALEAVLGAIYLDGGIDAAGAFVERIYAPLLHEIREGRAPIEDAKTALQEYLQAQDRPLAEYRVVAETGPEHRKTFYVELSVEGTRLARARGRSKKEAELLAARRALGRLERVRSSGG